MVVMPALAEGQVCGRGEVKEMAKYIRATLTFEIGEGAVREEIVDRLDGLIEENFSNGEHGIVDVSTRWVAALADSPLFGSASGEAEAVPTPDAMFDFLEGDDDALNEASLLATNN